LNDTLGHLTDPAIHAALDALPERVLRRSGSVFYTGPDAFAGPADLYILGLNPGGSPIAQADETVARDIEEWRQLKQSWSAYADESWAGRVPGKFGMQARMLHMFDEVGLDPRKTPASNMFFVRSEGEAQMAAEKADLMQLCWPVHAAVIDAVQVKTVLCLGGTTGNGMRARLRADREIARWSEKNLRGWTSTAHEAENGTAVITVSHPSRADWRNPASDPSPLIREVLRR
tara:strand:+ start:1437 stop:2129 length:693 start_codon:yes stop_codon:yes gene_type:complete